MTRNCDIFIHRQIRLTKKYCVLRSSKSNGLRAQPLERFTVGALNCRENWIPLARSALYTQGGRPSSRYLAGWLT